MKNIFFALMLMTMGASCGKNEIDSPLPRPVNKVTKISSNPNDYQVFEYNGQGQLSKYISQWENGAGAINKITYTLEYKDYKPVKLTNDAGYTLYSYQGNTPEKEVNFFK